MTAPVLTGRGTPERVWRDAGVPDGLPAIAVADLVPPSGRVVVLAPHPDDEVLGCGGTLALLAAAGCRVEVVAVSDGEASHPGRAEELRTVRHTERADALAVLGLGGAGLRRLHEPDGGVSADRVAEQVAPLVGPDDLLLAPWELDGHPDHDAVGRAAARLPGRRWSYLVWAWHWATPGELPLASARRVPLGPGVAASKRAATGRYASQLEGDDPILPAWVLERLLRDDEVLLP